jgi:hypothetical protein
MELAMKDRDIFIAALEKDAAERSSYLDRACGTDHALRRRIEELSAEGDPATEILQLAKEIRPDVMSTS